MIDYNREQFLRSMAARIRQDIVAMLVPPKGGHLGGSCSCVEVVTALYFHVMRHDPRNPAWPERDRFIMSKGHAGLTQYAALAECGYFAREELWRNKELGCRLQGHPDRLKTQGIEANTGSLGQGLSLGLGMALAARLDGDAYRVYVLLGDGELAEGQVWEAAMAAAAFRVDNLVAVIDNNGQMATGRISERLDMGKLKEKWEAFGWHAVAVDGHDVAAVAAALENVKALRGQPAVIIAHTVKGKGIPFAENNPAFHNAAMTGEQYALALSATGARAPGGGA